MGPTFGQPDEWDQPEKEYFEQLGGGQFADREEAAEHIGDSRLENKNPQEERNLVHDREDNPDLDGARVIEYRERFRQSADRTPG